MQKHPGYARTPALAALLLAGLQPVLAADCQLPEQDRRAVAAMSQEYIDAWKSNDPARVAATLAEDVVMVPHHGVQPRVGKQAVLDWWFPGGEVAAPIVNYEISLTEVSGCADMAFDRGRMIELSWTFDGKTYTNRDGNFMTIYRRGADGAWKIVRRIWNDPLPQVDDQD